MASKRTIDTIRKDIAKVEQEDPNVCCCGSSIDHDAMGHGHQPVSMKDYTLSRLHEELKKAIDEHQT